MFQSMFSTNVLKKLYCSQSIGSWLNFIVWSASDILYQHLYLCALTVSSFLPFLFFLFLLLYWYPQTLILFFYHLLCCAHITCYSHPFTNLSLIHWLIINLHPCQWPHAISLPALFSLFNVLLIPILIFPNPFRPPSFFAFSLPLSHSLSFLLTVPLSAGKSGPDSLYVSLQAFVHITDADAAGHRTQTDQYGGHSAVQLRCHPMRM